MNLNPDTMSHAEILDAIGSLIDHLEPADLFDVANAVCKRVQATKAVAVCIYVSQHPDMAHGYIRSVGVSPTIGNCDEAIQRLFPLFGAAVDGISAAACDAAFTAGLAPQEGAALVQAAMLMARSQRQQREGQDGQGGR